MILSRAPRTGRIQNPGVGKDREGFGGDDFWVKETPR